MKSKNASASTWDTSTWDRTRAIEDRQLLNESRSRTMKSKRYLKDTITASKRTLRQIQKSADVLAQAQPRYLDTQKMIATFMKASTPLEAYLQEGGQLSERDLSSIELTVSGLVTFLAAWKRKHTPLMMSSDAFAGSPSFRKAHKKPLRPNRRMATK